MWLIRGFLSGIDRLSTLLVIAAALMLVGLIAVSLSEVFARYVLNAPTLWAFDVVNFFNGSILTLAAAYAQKNGAHVSIDIFHQALPPRFGRYLIAAMLLFLVLPTLGLLAYEAANQTWRFYWSGRLLESAWKPLRWPFYLPMAIGLWVLWLQCVATIIRFSFERFATQDPQPSEGVHP